MERLVSVQGKSNWLFSVGREKEQEKGFVLKRKYTYLTEYPQLFSDHHMFNFFLIRNSNSAEFYIRLIDVL